MYIIVSPRYYSLQNIFMGQCYYNVSNSLFGLVKGIPNVSCDLSAPTKWLLVSVLGLLGMFADCVDADLEWGDLVVGI